MSFSYNLTQDRALDRIRFLLQDTCDPPELQDEEIEAVYSRTDQETAVTMRISVAAYELAMVLYRRYAMLVTASSSGESMQYTQRAQEWYKAAQSLKESAGQGWSQVVQTRRRYDLVTDYQDNSYIRSKEL